MSLGKGATYASSKRQRVNTKHSTVAELLGINNILPQILWTHYFLEAQGYPVHPTKFYQVYMSTLLLGKNGKPLVASPVVMSTFGIFCYRLVGKKG